MQISITTTEGKTINLEVNDTSETIDLKIHGPTRKLIIHLGTDPEPETEAVLKIFVSTLGGKVWELEVKENETIGTVKAKIHELGGPTVDKQRLLYEGRRLSDFYSMADYRIRNESTLVMMSPQCGC